MTIEERYQLFTGGISALSYYVQVLKGKALEEFGLRGSSANCLFFLDQNRQGLTSSELTDLCGQDKAAVSRSLAELEEAGMVKVCLENGKRYRAKFYLTQKGLEAASKLWDAIRTCVLAGGDLLSEEERDLFYGCLRRIQESLKRLLTPEEDSD